MRQRLETDVNKNRNARELKEPAVSECCGCGRPCKISFPSKRRSVWPAFACRVLLMQVRFVLSTLAKFLHLTAKPAGTAQALEAASFTAERQCPSANTSQTVARGKRGHFFDDMRARNLHCSQTTRFV